MTIKTLKFKNLYGFMTKTIEFKEGVSILVGINGSGKTSVLNIINWVIKPSLADLCTVEFDNIELTFSMNACTYTIYCEQNDVELLITITDLSNSRIFNKIQATFQQHPKLLTKNEPLKESLLSGGGLFRSDS